LTILVVLCFGFAPAEVAGGALTFKADDQTKNARVVEEFMTLMIERQLTNGSSKSTRNETDEKMLALLAPYYFATIGVDQRTVTVNKYSPEGFRVVSSSGDYVFVKLTRKKTIGPANIIFKTAEYQGRIYIEPSSIHLAGGGDPNLVTPWFYVIEKNDTTADGLVLPDTESPRPLQVMPSPRENTATQGVALVAKLMNYLVAKDALPGDERRRVFNEEILPHLARTYTNMYGISIDYYEDLHMDPVKSYVIKEASDSLVIVGCDECLYNRYHFRIVVEDGLTRIMPTGIDNNKRTLSPVWFRE
jgi:hypothetical protein